MYILRKCAACANSRYIPFSGVGLGTRLVHVQVKSQCSVLMVKMTCRSVSIFLSFYFSSEHKLSDEERLTYFQCHITQRDQQMVNNILLGSKIVIIPHILSPFCMYKFLPVSEEVVAFMQIITHEGHHNLCWLWQGLVGRICMSKGLGTCVHQTV